MRSINKGERVRVTFVDDMDSVPVGAVGTAIESCVAPWVRFDEPVPGPPESGTLPGWATGYMACLSQPQLEVIGFDPEFAVEPQVVEPQVASCAEPHHAIVHDEKAHRLHHWKERLICLGFCGTVHAIWELWAHFYVH